MSIFILAISLLITYTAFGQEIEPEGIFSLRGTLWEYNGSSIGFYGGDVYLCSSIGNCTECDYSSYFSLPFLGSFSGELMNDQLIENLEIDGFASPFFGFGFLTECYDDYIGSPTCYYYFMNKVSNRFSP